MLAPPDAIARNKIIFERDYIFSRHWHGALTQVDLSLRSKGNILKKVAYPGARRLKTELEEEIE